MEANIFRGQIYYAQLPLGGKYAQVGNRPVIIVSNNIGNAHSGIVTVVPITSKNKKQLPTHFDIVSGKIFGTALCEQIVTISKEMLGDYASTLTPFQLTQLDYSVSVALGLYAQQESAHNRAIEEQIQVCEKLREELQSQVDLLSTLLQGKGNDKPVDTQVEQPVKRTYNKRSKEEIESFVTLWSKAYFNSDDKKDLANRFGFSSCVQAAQFYKRWRDKI